MTETVLVGSEDNLTFCIQDHFHQCETIYNWGELRQSCATCCQNTI